jgi:hypothetical protein
MNFKLLARPSSLLLNPELTWMQAGFCMFANGALALLWSRYVVWRVEHLLTYAPFALFVFYFFFTINKYLHRKRFWNRNSVRVGWMVGSWFLLYALVALLGAGYYALLILSTELASQKFSTALLAAGGWYAVLPGTTLVVLMIVAGRNGHGLAATNAVGAKSQN